MTVASPRLFLSEALLFDLIAERAGNDNRIL
jgi:hypothetical protein